MTSVACGNSYWTGLAQCYEFLGPPLRPSAADIQVFENMVPSEASRALLLGVTPDIVRMRWPRACALWAADSSWPMVSALRSRTGSNGHHVVCADWLSLPFGSGAFDLAIGDGSTIAMSYPRGLRAMAVTLHSALRHGGKLILRCYLQPQEPEHPERVFEDLRSGRIPSFHHFKLRLLMAMQRNVENGVAVADVYERWRLSRPHVPLPACAGWEPPVVDTIEHYCDSETVYWFPTLTEFRAVMLDLFDELSLTVPAGPLGDRCPILVLQPRTHDRR